MTCRNFLTMMRKENNKVTDRAMVPPEQGSAASCGTSEQPATYLVCHDPMPVTEDAK
jgi:hypothetical protein